MDIKDIALIIIFITLIILLLIAGIAIVIIIANKQRITQQASFDKELRAVEQEVQENILSNVARELHDNIGQLLTVAHLQIKTKSIKHPETAPFLQPVSNTINDITLQVKALGKSLNTDLLKDKGLKENITLEVIRLQSLDRFTIDWTCDETPTSIPRDSQLVVFRIFQEVINNAIKYADAKTLRINMQGTPFKMSIEDNGKGFNLEAEMQKGMGLRNIIKRTHLANLTCDINTSIGEGCIFSIHQPV